MSDPSFGMTTVPVTNNEEAFARLADDIASASVWVEFPVCGKFARLCCGKSVTTEGRLMIFRSMDSGDDRADERRAVMDRVYEVATAHVEDPEAATIGEFVACVRAAADELGSVEGSIERLILFAG